ncbi:MAG: LeuA family protein [Acidobacteriota bacterium]|nr:LeuA family protein [Blastocatellia bacterium]MDW8412985.1 LeuA family protein [Acidobacteriota bacterium]
MLLSELIYDWNKAEAAEYPTHAVEFDDETLRDGLQSPSVTDPPIEKKLELLHLMESLGIDAADIGLPGAGPRARQDVLRLAKEIADNRMRIRPNCAARTVISDIVPIAEISQQVGLPIEVAAFIGSSPIRQYAEEWTIDRMLRATEETAKFCTKHGLPLFYVTEDTTRAHPETLRKLYKTAIEFGARRICVADTVGHATPSGAKAIIKFIKQLVAETGEAVKVDWHGHQDRGLGVINSIAAYEAGADRIHGTALGVGERVGNTPMDQLLVNFQLLGYIDRDLTALKKYCEVTSEALQIPIPPNYPVVGSDAFRTATGVHAAAVVKAFRKNDEMLANLVYSSVPANLFGLEQIIDIGPMSGKSNVVFWLERRGIEPTEERVERIFTAAKRSTHVLTTDEIMQYV